MKNPILFLCLCLGLFQTAFAQPTPPVEVPSFTIEYRMMAWSGSIWELYTKPQLPPGGRAPVTETEPETISFGSHRPSDWFAHSGPLPLPIYKKGETTPVPVEIAGVEGLEVPRPVAYINPGASGKWLILMIKDKDEVGNLIYRTKAIPDNNGDLEEGYLVINFTESPLAIQMNEEYQQLSPGSRAHFTPQANEDVTVDVKIAENSGGGWKLKKSNTFVMPEKGLTMLFVTKRGRRVWIRRFVDKPLPEIKRPPSGNR